MLESAPGEDGKPVATGNRFGETADDHACDCACGGNRFCNSLEAESRQALCSMCAIRSFGKGDQLDTTRFHGHIMLILDGLMTTVKSTSGKMQYLYTPCDVFAHEYLFNSQTLPYEQFGLIRALRPLTAAFFPAQRLQQLFLTRPDVSRALYVNLSTMYNQKCFYRLMVEMDDARHAVQYMLPYLAERGVEQPTHEELAFMTGLNRVTVTRALKDIYRGPQFRTVQEYMSASLAEE